MMRSSSSARAESRITGMWLALADVPAERKAVLARHHDVEDDQVDPVFLDGLAGRLGAIDCGGAASVLAQELRQQLADLAVVVNDQDMGVFRRHGSRCAPRYDKNLPSARVGLVPNLGGMGCAGHT